MTPDPQKTVQGPTPKDDPGLNSIGSARQTSSNTPYSFAFPSPFVSRLLYSFFPPPPPPPFLLSSFPPTTYNVLRRRSRPNFAAAVRLDTRRCCLVGQASGNSIDCKAHILCLPYHAVIPYSCSYPHFLYLLFSPLTSNRTCRPRSGSSPSLRLGLYSSPNALVLHRRPGARPEALR